MIYRVQRGTARMALDVALPDNLEYLGLGVTPTASQLISAAGTGVSAGISTKSIVGGSISAGLATAALFDPEPISKAILAISAAFVGPLMQAVNRGCGQTCIIASQAADQAMAAAEQVKHAYWGTPTPRPRSLQQAALTALHQIADALTAACSNPQLGDAGKRCISERLVEGGSAPWCPGGGCDFWTTYYRPIESDPNVVDPTIVETALSTLGLPAGTNTLGLLGLGLLALAVLL